MWIAGVLARMYFLSCISKEIKAGEVLVLFNCGNMAPFADLCADELITNTSHNCWIDIIFETSTCENDMW